MSVIHHSPSLPIGDSSQSIRLAGCPPWTEINFHTWGAGRTLDRHAHPYLQLILVLRGQLDVDWGEGWQAVRAGEVHVLPPDRPHRLRSPQGHGQFGINCRTQGDERGLLTALLVGARPAVRSWPAGVAAAHAVRGGLTDRLAIAQALDRAALDLLDGGDRPIDRLIPWLTARTGQPIDVARTARDLGTSRSRLQAECRVRHGCGVAHLHERLRLEAAAALLLGEPAASLETIAARCGYLDNPGFSRAFRRHFGLPPGRWRRRGGIG